MIYRCGIKSCPDYHNYGARGISVCDEWLEFIVFKQWALANGYADNLTLDRRDVNGNYEPNNCKWATIIEQNNNKRNVMYITIDGVTDTLTGFAKRTGIRQSKLWKNYHKLGLRGEDIFK